jgi:hypothetical protein
LRNSHHEGERAPQTDQFGILDGPRSPNAGADGVPLRETDDGGYARPMAQHEREWVLAHLSDQARHLAATTDATRHHPGEPDRLVAVRDEVFTIRETLDTLGVPHALVTNADWNQAIGTTFD